jgi:hypothetical protein
MNEWDVSVCEVHRFVRTIHARQMSPFKLYLYLKPLYSKRGGSTMRADPFTKQPLIDTLRLEPRYK